MQVDRQQFREEGYNILREVVPKAELEPLRRGIEHMVSRRKELSAQRRFPYRSTRRRLGEFSPTALAI